MKTHIVERTADQAKGGRRWLVTPNNGNNTGGVVCETKAAAQEVQRALSNGNVLWFTAPQD